MEETRTPAEKRPSSVLLAVIIAFGVFSTLMLLQGSIFFDVGDEGHLWYATIRTAEGQTPILDFRSYDPGRYYWTAATSYLLGDGILALRWSATAFAAIGLTLALLAARRLTTSWWKLILIGLMLAAWAVPRHKLFDHAILYSAIYVGVRLLESPTLRMHFISGLFVGLAAFLGRNHGLYNFLGFLLLIIFISVKLDRSSIVRRLPTWGAGILIGYSPVFLLMAMTPGFFESFIDSIRYDTGMLAKPVPWPWKFYFSRQDLLANARFLINLTFFLAPLFYALTLLTSWLSSRGSLRNRPLLVACGCIGVFYLFHAYGRADIAHLAQSIHPMLLGAVPLVGLLPARIRKVAVSGVVLFLIASTAVAIHSNSYLVRKLTSPPGGYVLTTVRGDVLSVRRETAEYVAAVRRIVEEDVGPDDGFFIGPYKAGIYPVIDRESPVWESFFPRKVQEEKQRGMIRDFSRNRVNWAIVSNSAVDGQDDRRFRNTHHLLQEHLEQEFVVVAAPDLPDEHRLYRRKQPL